MDCSSKKKRGGRRKKKKEERGEREWFVRLTYPQMSNSVDLKAEVNCFIR